MLNPGSLKNGQSHHEYFYSKIKRMKLCQYDYRSNTGKLFSCVGKSLEECVSKMERWAKEESDAIYM